MQIILRPMFLVCLATPLFLCGVAAKPAGASPIQEESPAAQTRAWQQAHPYSAPDFEEFFPDDEAGGQTLDRLYRGGGLHKLDDAKFIEAFRRGMRRKTEYNSHLTQALARRFLWTANNAAPQNPDAIELFYHMSDSPSLRKYAIKNGLTCVREKTPAILHALVDLCVKTERARDLTRILDYCKGQSLELDRWLEPHQKSPDEMIRTKAQHVRQMFLGTLTPLQWSQIPKPIREMPKVRQILREGSSSDRSTMFGELLRSRSYENLDPACLPDLAVAAKDKDYHVRKQVVWLATHLATADSSTLNEEALQLLLFLSHDPDRHVRESVVYDALRTSRIFQNKAAQTRMLEMVIDPHNAGSHRDLLQTLRRFGPALRSRLTKEIAGDDKAQAWASYELYLRVFEQVPSDVPMDIFPPKELSGTWLLEITAPPTSRSGGNMPSAFTVPVGFHARASAGEDFVQPLLQDLLWTWVGDTLHISCNYYIEGSPLRITAQLQGDTALGSIRLPVGEQQYVWKAVRAKDGD